MGPSVCKEPVLGPFSLLNSLRKAPKKDPLQKKVKGCRGLHMTNSCPDSPPSACREGKGMDNVGPSFQGTLFEKLLQI